MIDLKKFLHAKFDGYDIRTKKDLTVKKNNNSADYITPSFATGCVAGCSYCVKSGTMIMTPNGETPIEQIQEGDLIIAYDSLSQQLVEARVGQTAQRQVEELIELEVEGSTIRVTSNHPFLTQRGWVKAGDLLETDQLICI